jgi:hypothetical protein
VNAASPPLAKRHQYWYEPGGKPYKVIQIHPE